MMLAQARIEPGMRVLEIGSGGYNAALIAELVGPSGRVVSLDIDPEVTERARKLLAGAGYPQVRVITADGTEGAPWQAPFDRIVVTAGAWDIPPAWRDQLTDTGRLVVPLRMRSLTRSVAFRRRGERLVGDSALICGFVPMQGPVPGPRRWCWPTAMSRSGCASTTAPPPTPRCWTTPCAARAPRRGAVSRWGGRNPSRACSCTWPRI
ncbi:methyltransferase domain-containing protein [Nocardiopsis composta]